MKTALVVIDMQNSFLHKEGENYFQNSEKIIGNVSLLINRAEEKNSYIIHISDEHRLGFEDFEQRVLPVHCMSGSFNAQFFNNFGPNGRAREIAITKRRYSAFFATDLALFLREQKIETIILCGVKTNLCVRATAQDAFAHGFKVITVSDATNSNREHLEKASLEDISRYFGTVVDTIDAMDLFQ
ncbi:MAG: cysteine hydrolase [Rhodobacteraceae bacterium]|nr:cysteine hydrolase [Paracoccaceae bacterium]